MNSNSSVTPASDSTLVVAPELPYSSSAWEQAKRVVTSRRHLILGVGFMLMAATFAIAFSLKNTYQPVARVEIDPLEAGIKTLQEIEAANGVSDQDYLETQVQILQSEALATRVIRALHLDRNAEFASRVDSKKPVSAPAGSGKPTGPGEDGTAFLREQFDLANRTALEETALRSFQRRLTVTPVRNSRLIEVSFASHDPQLAATVTNTLATQFIDQNFKNRYSSTIEASEWLSAQLNALRRKVADSTQAVADYEQRYGLVDAEDDNAPMSQLIAEQDHQLSEAQAARIEAEAYVRMIDLGQSDALPALRDDQVYQNLITRYADIRSQLAQAQTVYGDENSNVKKLENESAEMSSQIEAERERVVDRSRIAFEVAQARERMLARSRDQLRAEIEAKSSHRMEHQLLKSEVLANSELYNTLQGRLSEAGIYAGLRSSNIHIVDLAPTLVTASGPHRLFIVTIGTVASWMFACVLAFVFEGFDDTVRSEEDVKNWSGLPSLAVLPGAGAEHRAIKSWRRRFLREPEADELPKLGMVPLAQNESIRNLRTSLLIARVEAPRVILVSSSVMGEGKTTVAVNLAVSLAQRGRTCLLIDADLRRPRVADVFEINPAVALGDLLNTSGGIEPALVKTASVPGLSLVINRGSNADPADALGSERMREILEETRAKFDFVVVDSPPVIPFSDARLLAVMADAVILVSRYGFTTKRALALSASLFGDIQAPLRGVVLNGVDGTLPDYYGAVPPASNASASESLGTNRKDPEPPQSQKSKGAHA